MCRCVLLRTHQILYSRETFVRSEKHQLSREKKNQIVLTKMWRTNDIETLLYFIFWACEDNFERRNGEVWFMNCHWESWDKIVHQTASRKNNHVMSSTLDFVACLFLPPILFSLLFSLLFKFWLVSFQFVFIYSWCSVLCMLLWTVIEYRVINFGFKKVPRDLT